MTTGIVLLSALISIIAFSNHGLMQKLIFNPYLVKHGNQWYRFLSSGLIHADWMHLFINMLVLYSFGKAVEVYYHHHFGHMAIPYFLMLYIGGLVISILPTYKRHNDHPHYNSLGASGAVSAVVFASIFFSPMRKIYLYFLVGLPGILLGVLYLVYSFYMGKKGSDNINHDAHLWGAIFGFLFTFLLKPSLIENFIAEILSFSL